MISRTSARMLAEIFQALFSRWKSSGTTVNEDALYDFLYDRDYDAWFCNDARKAAFYTRGLPADRWIKDFFMKVHTGEAFVTVTQNWKQSQRQKLAQRYLQDLCNDILVHQDKSFDQFKDARISLSTIGEFRRSLELDGYLFSNGQLLFSEADVLDTEAEAGLLSSLYQALDLENQASVIHFLELTEQNFIAGHWGDTISNSRNFLECTLREIAAAHSKRYRNIQLSENVYSKAFEVRQYLEREGLLEAKETKALAEVYGLLSNTGSHPYMAEADQARLMRHLGLTFSQFALLRYQGYLKQKDS